MNETTTTTEAPKSKLQAVDPAQLGQGLFSEKVIVDGSADAFAYAKPVDEGWYVAKLAPPKDPAIPMVQFREAGVSKDGKKYGRSFVISYTEVIEGHLDPNADNSDLAGKVKNFDFEVSTFVIQKDGKPTSEATSVLTKLGANIPAGTEVDIETIAAAMVKHINSGVARYAVRTQWVGGWEKGNKETGTYGRWLITGQANFPLAKGGVLGKGPYSATALVNNQEVHAKARIVQREALTR